MDGAGFSTPLNISNDSGASFSPQIGVDPSGNIKVAWQDDTPSGNGSFYDVFFSQSGPGGATFSTPLQVTTSNAHSEVSALKQITVSGNGNIYLLWIQFAPQFQSFLSVVASRSTDGGKTFASIGGLSFTSSGRMAVDPTGSNIGIVGFADIDTAQPFGIGGFSTDGGTSFTRREIGGPFSDNEQIAVDAIGRFDVTYVQPGGNFSGFGQIPPCLCFTQTADGNEFSGTSITSYVPALPAVMALDPGGNVSVAWLQSSTRGGNANVFFSRAKVLPFSFTLSPTRVVGGSSGSVTGTVKVISPASAGGAAIALSSNNPSASVPASVTVPEGANSATFTISTNQVSSQTVAEISASFDGGTNTATLVVEPVIASFFFEGSPIGGNPAGGFVGLGLTAPSGGVVVSLTSSNPSVVSVPTSVTVPAGSSFLNFPITTSPVTAPTTVQLTATSSGSTKSVSITIQPATPQQLSVSPTTATGGASSTGTVRLNGPAPAGGAAIALSSSDPSATVPASVTIPGGSTSASFTITTNPGSATTNVTISASYSGVTLNISLTVQPVILQQVTVSTTAIGGGATVSGNVRINVPAPPGGVAVSLSSSNPSIASVPASVTIPEGSVSLLQLFNINTSPVSADTPVTISASLNGITLTTTFTLQPIKLAFLVAFDLQGGTSGNFAVVLNGPANSPIVVSLTNSNPSVANVPATVTIPQGQTGQNFTVTTSSVTVLTQITITATYNGVTLNRTIGLHP